MIQFRQKVFSEYDAMHSLYNELIKFGNREKYGIIDQKALIPILRGNNVVIERFVISTYFGRRDRYRMYLKVGAKAKMPDEIRLPQNVYDKKLWNANLNIIGGGKQDGDKQSSSQQSDGQRYDNKRDNGRKDTKKFSERVKLFSDHLEQKEFKDGNGGGDPFKASFGTSLDISYEVRELLGDAIKYDKASRSVVLEFASIPDAVKALNILPFGINYRIYLLV